MSRELSVWQVCMEENAVPRAMDPNSDRSCRALDTAQRRAGRGHASLMRPTKPQPGVPFVGFAAMHRSDPDNRSNQRIWYGGGVIKPPSALCEGSSPQRSSSLSDAVAFERRAMLLPSPRAVKTQYGAMMNTHRRASALSQDVGACDDYRAHHAMTNGRNPGDRERASGKPALRVDPIVVRTDSNRRICTSNRGITCYHRQSSRNQCASRVLLPQSACLDHICHGQVDE
jgi:hypothetical protein